jgi:hypothetical protein
MAKQAKEGKKQFLPKNYKEKISKMFAMDEFQRWLIEIVVSIASFLIGLVIAIYLYKLEKRRDEYQTRQTDEFNKWMRAQTERQTAMIEALEEGLPEAQARELTERVAKLLPGSIKIGDVTIERANIRMFQSFMGGQTYVEAIAYDGEGERLSAEFNKMKGKVIKFVSPDHIGVVELQETEIEKVVAEGAQLYVFHIWLRIKG